MAEIKKMIQRRAYNKGLITQDLKLLDSLSDEQVNVLLLDDYIHKLESNLVIIEEFDSSICELLSDSEMEEAISSNRSYCFKVQQKIAELKLRKEKLVKSSKSLPGPTGKIVKLSLPQIQIQPFENNSNNPFAYFNFKKTSVNALAGMPNLTEAQKFIYLKGYLQGGALNLVENIPVNDSGYSSAFKQLDFDFLDV